jgi:O-acetyl-ADP-ribose deacetylase (regulator of RNase III)
MAVSRRWLQPAMEYKRWFQSKSGFELGEVQFVQAEPTIWIANMIGQRGIRTEDGVPPIRYEAVRQCLEKVAVEATTIDATVHMPRIGCGLAGGDWLRIESIIVEALCGANVKVTVYDFQ